MSQADVVTAMRQKDIEKTLALEEIKTAEALQSRGYKGKLLVSLVGVRGFDGQSSGANLTYTLSPPDWGEVIPADETKGSVAGHLLVNRDVALSLCLEVPVAVAPVVENDQLLVIEKEVEDPEAEVIVVPSVALYNADFDCKELPEQGYMQLELIGKSESQKYSDVRFNIKVSYEEFSKIIIDKTTEVVQIQQQMKDLNNSTKEAGRTKSGKQKKQKKDFPSGEKAAQWEDVGPSNFEIARNTAETVAVFVMSTRSYWLFGAAAIGIFYVGEYASI